MKVKKVKLIQKRNNAEQRDYLQKSGGLLVRKEIESLSTEEAYYLALERECKIQGFDSYREMTKQEIEKIKNETKYLIDQYFATKVNNFS